jgi:hypothetical protein
MIELAAARAEERDHVAIDGSDGRAEVLRHLGDLPRSEFSRKKALPLLGKEFSMKFADCSRRIAG